MVKTLSFKEVEKLSRQPGDHAVGGCRGLYLQVKNGGVSWKLRIMVSGKRKEIGLGSYLDVPLEKARRLGVDLRQQVQDGIDPVTARQQARQERLVAKAKTLTFAECVDAYLEAHGDAWKNPKHFQQWRNTLQTYAHPVFGKLPAADIDTGLVMKCLEPIWKTKTETASRLRGRIEQVLDWATVRGYRQGLNPARWKGHLDKLLPAKGKIAKVEHHSALPYQQVNAFMAALKSVEGFGARALEFSILTAARSGEVRGATWKEIDLKAGVWLIPAGRMKAEKEHWVPLSPQAIKLLNTLPRIEGTDLVFPGTKGQLSDMTVGKLIKRIDEADRVKGGEGWRDGDGSVVTMHGFRSTFRDWAGETTAHPREVIEHALAHLLKDKAEAAYARGTLFEKRRRLMDDWAKHCHSKPRVSAKVVPIGRARAAR